MRRLVVLCVSLLALVGATSASAERVAQGDGTLVVRDGTAPKGVAVVTLVIRGAVIGQVSNGGTIQIEDRSATADFAPEITNADWRKDRADGATTVTTAGGASQFKFRAVGGLYKITIWGSNVDLVASGYGKVQLTGSPDAPDGWYSLNGADFKSLPATATRLTFGSPNG